MTESDHGVNENMIEMSEHERGVQQRLSIAMQGRRPYAWAADVHLSRGAIGRLQKGNLPDAVKLVPALRIDRLSLSGDEVIRAHGRRVVDGGLEGGAVAFLVGRAALIGEDA